MKTIKLNSSGFSHHLLVALIAMVFVAGFGAYKVFYSKAATTVVPFTCCATTDAVVVVNPGSPDIVVKIGETKSTGNNPNYFKKYHTGAGSDFVARFEYCGRLPSSYSKGSIFTWSSATNGFVQKYPGSTNVVKTVGVVDYPESDPMKNCKHYDANATTIDVCKLFVKIRYSYPLNKFDTATETGYVKKCTFLSTTVSNNGSY